MDLVEKAIRMDEAIKSDIYRKGEELTGGLNLNSNQQMLKWIEEQEGYPVSGFDKDTRDTLLKNQKTMSKVRSCLEIKEKVCKISTKKYGAIEDLDIALQFVKKENITALKLFFANPTDVLSQLIRTAFVAEEGSRFIVADVSAIEARVLAWLAEEKWQWTFLQTAAIFIVKVHRNV